MSDDTVVVADAYPNFSICGIPYYISGEVTHWRNLAHRTYADLEATGMKLRLDTWALSIDVSGQRLAVRNPDGSNDFIGVCCVVRQRNRAGLSDMAGRPVDMGVPCSKG